MENVYNTLENSWTEEFALHNQGQIISWASLLVSPFLPPSSLHQLTCRPEVESCILHTCPQRVGNLSFSSFFSPLVPILKALEETFPLIIITATIFNYLLYAMHYVSSFCMMSSFHNNLP